MDIVLSGEESDKSDKGLAAKSKGKCKPWGSPRVECECSSALISVCRKGQPNGTGGTERGGAKEQPYSAHMRLLSGGGPVRVIAWQYHQEVNQHDLCQDQAPQEGR